MLAVKPMNLSLEDFKGSPQDRAHICKHNTFSTPTQTPTPNTDHQNCEQQ